MPPTDHSRNPEKDADAAADADLPPEQTAREDEGVMRPDVGPTVKAGATQTQRSDDLRDSLSRVYNDATDALHEAMPRLVEAANGHYKQRYDNGGERLEVAATRALNSDDLYLTVDRIDDHDANTEYLFGAYGWADPADLFRLVPRLTDAVDVEQRNVTADIAADIEHAVTTYREDVYDLRRSLSLGDVAEVLRSGQTDLAKALFCADDEESQRMWQLMQSKTADEVVDNDVSVEVISPRDQFVFARTERTYVENGGTEDTYAFGVVVGVDDTDERFFVHRVESSTDLKDFDVEWTPAMVREAMGFNRHLWSIPEGDFPEETRVRLQGDLMAVRRGFADLRAVERRRVYLNNLRSATNRLSPASAAQHTAKRAVADDHPALEGAGTPAYGADTEALTDLQEAVGIDEETVREWMRDDWKILTAERRRDILEDVFAGRDYERRLRADDDAPSLSDIRADTEETVIARFNPPEDSPDRGTETALVGNHAVFVTNAVTGPQRVDLGDGEEHFVLPDGGELVSRHGEHDDLRLSLPPGVYAVGFIDGFQREFWMDEV